MEYEQGLKTWQWIVTAIVIIILIIIGIFVFGKKAEVVTPDPVFKTPDPYYEKTPEQTSKLNTFLQKRREQHLEYCRTHESTMNYEDWSRCQEIKESYPQI